MKKNKKQNKSIGTFLAEFNEGKISKLDTNSVYRWIRAYNRGEFEEWDGQNDLSNVKCKSKTILKIINKSLKRKFPDSAVWNKVAKSKLSSEQYGVFAKKFIPCGTMLGFFKGNYVVSVSPLRGQHKCKLNAFSHIDGSDFMSCFARYHVSSSKGEHQNVSVERLSEWTDSNRAVCFIASKDITSGSELVIATDHQRNKNKRVEVYQQSNFKSEAVVLAAAFGN